MGQTCTNCEYCKKSAKDVEMCFPNLNPNDFLTKFSLTKSDARSKDKIIKIQSAIRAHLARKQYKGLKSKKQSNYTYNGNIQNPSNLLTDTGKIQREILFENGIKYFGQLIENIRDGYGIQEWPDGTKYEGNWKNDKAHGLGILWHNNGDKYEGNFVEEKANGKGKYIHSNGVVYDGEWVNDIQHGKGIETWPDG